MASRISDFDVSAYLDDDATIASYLSEVVAEEDPKLLLAAIGDIAKARGMSKIASDAGLGRGGQVWMALDNFDELSGPEQGQFTFCATRLRPCS